MKRSLIIIITIIAILATSTSGAFASSKSYKWKCKTRKHITSVYLNGRKVCKMKTNRKLNYKIVNSTKLTRKTLTHRKNKYVLIEKVKWTPTDRYGNGKTSDGYYIAYDYDADVTFKVGKYYTSYLIYGNNNSVDDIIKRIDTF